jgi:uncharacterized LabA/DUF88 family protein
MGSRQCSVDGVRGIIYIDGNNLYRAAVSLGFEIDYRKLRGWLRQKYNPTYVYLFVGFIPKKATFYNHLRNSGFILIFKQVISVNGVVKGNCDAELVLKVVSDFYTHVCTSVVLVTGDGDFGCLVDFLLDNKLKCLILAPDKNRCSIILKSKNVRITFLNDHFHKFCKPHNERAPDADASA